MYIKPHHITHRIAITSYSPNASLATKTNALARRLMQIIIFIIVLQYRTIMTWMTDNDEEEYGADVITTTAMAIIIIVKAVNEFHLQQPSS